MKRHRWAALGALLLGSACQVEQTPDEYFDHEPSVQEERNSAAEEVRDRVLAMGQALSRGNPSDALTALAPARDAYLVGPQAGLEVTGAEQIAAILASLAAQPIPVATRDVQVDVGPGGTVAWFRAQIEATGPSAEIQPVHITGIYVLNEGAWQLVQAHLSTPVMAQPPSNPAASAADSAGAE